MTLKHEKLTTSIRRWLPALVLIVAVTVLTAIIAGSQAKNQKEAVGSVNSESVSLARFRQEVRLKELKNELSARSTGQVNKPELLNRMIGDMLLLQAASDAGVIVKEAHVQEEIDRILGRSRLSRREMVQLLDKHNLAWTFFENSVRDYLTLSHFVDEVLLADVAPGEREAYLNRWMTEQYQAAEITFDQEFLDLINPTGSTTLGNPRG